MKTANDLLLWPRPKEEVLIYALLLLRGCKTKQDVEKILKNPYFQQWGYTNALRELFENLPQVLKTLNAIYGDEKGGEQ